MTALLTPMMAPQSDTHRGVERSQDEQVYRLRHGYRNHVILTGAQEDLRTLDVLARQGALEPDEYHRALADINAML